MSMLETIKGYAPWGKPPPTRRASAGRVDTSAYARPPQRDDAPAPDDSSIISEVVPSELGPDRGGSWASDEPGASVSTPVALTTLPLLQQQRLFVGLGVAGVVTLLIGAALTISTADRSTTQSNASGQALMQSQRLAKSASQALLGDPQAFAEVRESSAVLASNVRGLKNGSNDLPVAPALAQDTLDAVMPLVDRAESSANALLARQQALTQVGQAQRAINRQSADLLDGAESVAAAKVQQGASSNEVVAASRLVMLSQRIGKSANEFLTLDGASPESVFLLGKDVATFREIGEGLLNGSEELRLPATRDSATRERLTTLMSRFEQTRKEAEVILANLQGLVAAREAQSTIVADSERIRFWLERVQTQTAEAGSFGGARLLLIVLGVALVGVGGVGFTTLYLREQAQRSAALDAQRQEAERQEQEAKRVNDANQAAILRLMNELQAVADGDLTQQATVTEDITGAIADSVNYTVEELRSLVAQVQSTATRVAETTEKVESNSVELLAASTEQLREIRATGESVLQMAGRINEVSAQAQQTAEVAKRSLNAAESGLKAVNDTIGGMNQIRDQIQDTSKRIKRLGESSQEIGEITELISDITEQTNVLALNAAIQAASAGEAGRGFSVVAEEVQRLAERSADATRQIAALVKTIQSDTADAVAAMERSTQGVVEGAKLSDAAGAALADIDRVTRQLSTLISEISGQALQQADQANVVASNIQHIFAVTEQAGAGTRSTAQMVRELSATAEELRQSVSRFKIA